MSAVTLESRRTTPQHSSTIRYGALAVDDRVAKLFDDAGFTQCFHIRKLPRDAQLDTVELLVTRANSKWAEVLDMVNPVCVAILSPERRVRAIHEALEAKGYHGFDWPLDRGEHWVVQFIDSFSRPADASLPASDTDHEIEAWLARRIFRWFHV